MTGHGPQGARGLGRPGEGKGRLGERPSRPPSAACRRCLCSPLRDRPGLRLQTPRGDAQRGRQRPQARVSNWNAHRPRLNGSLRRSTSKQNLASVFIRLLERDRIHRVYINTDSLMYLPLMRSWLMRLWKLRSPRIFHGPDGGSGSLVL